MSNTTTPFVLLPTADHKEESWQTEFRKRLLAFAEAIKIAPETVLKVMEDLGVDPESSDCLTMLDSEEILTSADIFRVFVDTKLAGIARVRMGLAHLRGKTSLDKPTTATTPGNNDAIASAIKDLVEQNKPVDAMNIEELLARYDDMHPEVIKRLAAMSHGRPCIIYNRVNGEVKVNIGESAKLVRVAMKQPTSDTTMIAGKLTKVYRAGTEFPAEPIAESPFYPGTALVNGFCSVSTTDWNEVVYEARQLVRIYIQHCETAKLSKMQMKQLCDDAKLGVEVFRNKYQDAAIKFDELKIKDELPKLRFDPQSQESTSTSRRRDSGF